MKFKDFFKRKPSKMEELKKKDVSSSQKKKQTADDVIAMMKDFNVERRFMNVNFNGFERRRA